MPARAARKTSRKARRAARSTSRHAPRKTRRTSARKTAPKKWSGDVTRNSDALDLENSVFKKKKPADIARSLKRSAEHSRRRKSSPYRSAMSMLTFYVTRACKNWPKSRLRVLEKTKGELRKAFGRA